APLIARVPARPAAPPPAPDARPSPAPDARPSAAPDARPPPAPDARPSAAPDARPLVTRSPAVFAVALLQVALQLALDPLQGVVDGLDVAVELVGNFLVRLAFEVVHEDFPFQLAEEFAHALFDVEELLAADDQFLRIADLVAVDDVHQRPVGFLVVNRFVQRDVGVERDVLLPRGGFDGGDNLAGDAQFGERPERRQLVRPKVANRLVEADHALLDDVLAIGAN